MVSNVGLPRKDTHGILLCFIPGVVAEHYKIVITNKYK